jgi:hypothetical protein
VARASRRAAATFVSLPGPNELRADAPVTIAAISASAAISFYPTKSFTSAWRELQLAASASAGVCGNRSTLLHRKRNHQIFFRNIAFSIPIRAIQNPP